MTKLNKLAISSPANGLLIYQTDDTTGFWYYNSVKWVQAIGPAGPAGSGGTCPSGFVSVNAEYCIEANERSPVDWWNALSTCAGIGAHLCSWGEWYGACTLAPGGLNNMTNNFEFVDEITGANLRIVQVGNGSCASHNITGTTSGNISETRNFRCCFTK